ncbi:glycyl-radical enzyme activating protein [Acutalibacter intestini]|uniref:glycyl-radical enzyme activating protein n=1 Tax=Acutalibacter intestini TaxID=3093659 RepID=UPI002AC8E931|nr:glycyl-radical enzyme activating protein [Acutalibacter sp. M00204]
MEPKTTGIVFDIQRFCVYDGPGIRTTVFLKGCNMRCAWCHNPESFSPQPQLLYRLEKCARCGACTACPQGAHQVGEAGHAFHREKCAVCGHCAGLCPNGALELSGREMDAAQVMAEVDKDAKYYRSSGGGVTFSGGEASVQFNFLTELLSACKERGYHTALETNGLVAPERLKALAEGTDLFLLDFKHSDPQEHKRWTGAPLEPVLDSLALLDQMGARVALRCPIIPKVNDQEEHFAAIRGLRERHGCVESVEIMAYHDIGKTKWEALGQDYALAELKTVPPEKKRQWQEKAVLP